MFGIIGIHLMVSSAIIPLLGTTFLLGLRHGIDWDHIAAISDITGASNTKRNFFISFMYIVGHAAMILLLGIAAIGLGLTLPRWIDGVMEPIVGVTLLILGLWLIYTTSIQKGTFQMTSRWMLLYAFFQTIHNKLHTHKQPSRLEAMQPQEEVGSKQSFFIGAIHGIGAETPTQMVLFLTIAGVAGKGMGILILILFILGLMISNAIISTLLIRGYTKVQKNHSLYRIVGLASGVVSIIIGCLFISGHGTILPAPLGD